MPVTEISQPVQHRWRSRVLTFLLWAAVAISLMLLAIAVWIRFRFGVVSLEAIVLNLPIAGGEGEGVGNDSLVGEALIYCIGLPILLTVGLALGIHFLRRRRSIAQQKPLTPLRRRTRVGWPVITLTVSLSVLLSTMGVPQYAMALLKNDSFAQYYVTPKVTSSPTKAKNLVTIYLESMENTFERSDIFGQNLLANLDTATKGWSEYDLEQFPTGGFTMAGIVGTQCGIPLKSRTLLPGGPEANALGESVARYLPGAVCLGDVLAENGYTNVDLGGADESFAGKGKYFLDHGYSSVKGLDYWKKAGIDESKVSSVWGMSDAELFSRAKTELAELRAAGTPFNLTMLTLDTHEPGQLYSTCSGTESNPMATSVKCSMKAVAGFLDYMKANGYMEDTVVIVMGDHLKPTGELNHFTQELSSVQDRTIVCRIWSPDPIQFTREGADQLSLLPTTLSLLGFGLTAGRAGLGVSFVGDSDISGSALELSDEAYEAAIQSPSTELYRAFWAGND